MAPKSSRGRLALAQLAQGRTYSGVTLNVARPDMDNHATLGVMLYKGIGGSKDFARLTPLYLDAKRKSSTVTPKPSTSGETAVTSTTCACRYPPAFSVRSNRLFQLP